MLLPYQLGIGGTLGAGKQYMSWITLDDTLGALYHCLMTESLEGAVNLVASQAVTNREFTKTLGKVLKRPTLIPVPPLALKAMFGEMGQELLLDSIRVESTTLDGYCFRHPDLESGLRHVLGRL
jgi:NAD dependent epimerase/dehydratase family enzyme